MLPQYDIPWSAVCMLYSIPISIPAIWLFALLRLRNTAIPSTEKLIWALVITFAPVLGPILFLTMEHNPPKGEPDPSEHSPPH